MKRRIILIVFMLIVGISLTITFFYSKNKEEENKEFFIESIVEKKFDDADVYYGKLTDNKKEELSEVVSDIFIIHGNDYYEKGNFEEYDNLLRIKENYIYNDNYWKREFLSEIDNYIAVFKEPIYEDIACISEFSGNFSEYSNNLVRSLENLETYISTNNNLYYELANDYAGEMFDVYMPNCGAYANYEDVKTTIDPLIESSVKNPSLSNVENNTSVIMRKLDSQYEKARTIGDLFDEWNDRYTKIIENLDAFDQEIKELKNLYL